MTHYTLTCDIYKTDEVKSVVSTISLINKQNNLIFHKLYDERPSPAEEMHIFSTFDFSSYRYMTIKS